MTRPSPRLSGFCALVVACVFAVSASAEKGGQGKGGGNPGKGASQGAGKGASHGGGKGNAQGKGGKGSGEGHGNAGNSAAKGHGGKKFDNSQRSAIQSYYRDEYSGSGNCPPGLAKKNNGCQPPGQAKRNWDVGDPLPSDVVLLPLPPALRTTIAVPYPGYDYGYYGGEVVLFGTSDRIVVDIVATF